MPRTINDGVDIAYEVRGRGPPVVLLMGLSLPGSVWEARAEELVDEGLRVIVPDNRGTGASDVPWPPYTMQRLAEDVVAVVRDAGVSSAIVVGVSFGGAVAQHVALEHPERVDGLVLASTTPGFPTGQLPELWAVARLLRVVFTPDAVGIDDARELFAHSDSTDALEAFLERVDASLADQPTPARGALGQLTAMLGHHTGPRLREIRAPTRVMTGDSDVVIPPANAEILAAEIPGASLRVVPRAGHIAIHEDPPALREELEVLCDRLNRAENS